MRGRGAGVVEQSGGNAILKLESSRQCRDHMTLAFEALAREPLLHFLLLGRALFAVYGYMYRGRGGVESSRQIALTLEELRQMDLYFESQWRRQPTLDEFGRMVEDRVQEEILYREGLAMGLDKDDTIVKRRMAQKVRFLAEDVAAAHEPTTGELKIWYGKNSQKFALPGRMTFRHVYFSPDRRGHAPTTTLLMRSRRLRESRKTRRPRRCEPIASCSRSTTAIVRPSSCPRSFGPQFARAILKVNPGSWQGPIESGYGWHLVFVESFTPGRVPVFEEIESDVKTAWLGDQKEQAWRKAYQDMRANYTVLLPGPPVEQSARASTDRMTFVVWAFRGIVARRSLLAAPAAWAHEARPAYLEIKETATGRYTVLWRTPVCPGCACRLR